MRMMCRMLIIDKRLRIKYALFGAYKKQCLMVSIEQTYAYR